MLRVIADENFNNNLLRGLRLQLPRADLVRVQDVGLIGRSDPEVLTWAFQEGRVLLSHDVNTMPIHALERHRQSLPIPGIFLVPQPFDQRKIINDLVLIIQCSELEEWSGAWHFLPLG